MTHSSGGFSGVGVSGTSAWPSAAGEDADVAVQKLAPQVLVLWLVSGLISLGVVLAVSASVEFLWLRHTAWYGRLPLPTGLLTGTATLLLGVVPLLMVPLRYRRWSYAIRQQDVLIESGVVWRVRRSIPRSRVQHVDIRSGPLDRMLGVVQVDLHTAGSLEAVASIPGLTPPAAEALRASLVGGVNDGL
ncbi:MAG: PH domain-containing protein [Tepidisphaerales bacterium]